MAFASPILLGGHFRSSPKSRPKSRLSKKDIDRLVPLASPRTSQNCYENYSPAPRKTPFHQISNYNEAAASALSAAREEAAKRQQPHAQQANADATPEVDDGQAMQLLKAAQRAVQGQLEAQLSGLEAKLANPSSTAPLEDAPRVCGGTQTAFDREVQAKGEQLKRLRAECRLLESRAEQMSDTRDDPAKVTSTVDDQSACAAVRSTRAMLKLQPSPTGALTIPRGASALPLLLLLLTVARDTACDSR